MKGAVLALAAVLVMPAIAEAGGRSRSSFDFSIGFGYSGHRHHHHHRYHDFGVRYSRHYYPRPVYRQRVYVYEPAYIPAPVYVAPAPVYVAPPPAVVYKYRYGYHAPVRHYRYERRYYYR